MKTKQNIPERWLYQARRFQQLDSILYRNGNEQIYDNGLDRQRQKRSGERAKGESMKRVVTEMYKGCEKEKWRVLG
jgi:hypothetical protein